MLFRKIMPFWLADELEMGNPELNLVSVSGPAIFHLGEVYGEAEAEQRLRETVDNGYGDAAVVHNSGFVMAATTKDAMEFAEAAVAASKTVAADVADGMARHLKRSYGHPYAVAITVNGATTVIGHTDDPDESLDLATKAIAAAVGVVVIDCRTGQVARASDDRIANRSEYFARKLRGPADEHETV